MHAQRPPGGCGKPTLLEPFEHIFTALEKPQVGTTFALGEVEHVEITLRQDYEHDEHIFTSLEKPQVGTTFALGEIKYVALGVAGEYGRSFALPHEDSFLEERACQAVRALAVCQVCSASVRVGVASPRGWRPLRGCMVVRDMHVEQRFVQMVHGETIKQSCGSFGRQISDFACRMFLTS